MTHYKSIFFALLIITNLLGCDMFQDRIFDPMPEPLVIAEEIIGSWEIVSIGGEPIQYTLGARYADWSFDGDGSWQIYIFWDYGAYRLRRSFRGNTSLKVTFSY